MEQLTRHLFPTKRVTSVSFDGEMLHTRDLDLAGLPVTARPVAATLGRFPTHFHCGPDGNPEQNAHWIHI